MRLIDYFGVNKLLAPNPILVPVLTTGKNQPKLVLLVSSTFHKLNL